RIPTSAMDRTSWSRALPSGLESKCRHLAITCCTRSASSFLSSLSRRSCSFDDIQPLTAGGEPFENLIHTVWRLVQSPNPPPQCRGRRHRSPQSREIEDFFVVEAN